MLIDEYKRHGNQAQYNAIEEAIWLTQFIRNKCLRPWMDSCGINRNDLYCFYSQLAGNYAFASCLTSLNYAS
ncbi:hypothetical protein A4R35_09500 [Thermogemmatispora tikiterensis]|uniref:Transposase n=2 Tax=Thermogemmatispora tikiterensis TaxID=1825093 RepID=A0A328VFR6_9CHLR|nr:hypothetical protein A4R35_09500 [Thermogemmatispora tikiterensis]